MEGMIKQMLIVFIEPEKFSWSDWHCAQVAGLEKLLEAGAVSPSQLEPTKWRLFSQKMLVMHEIVQHGYLNLLQIALQYWPGVVRAEMYNNSWTLLHVASMYGQPAATQLLVNAGADLDVATVSNGMTALHQVAEWGFEGGPAVAEVLLRSGAQVDSKDRNGSTPIQLAAFCGKNTMVKLLLAAGADVNLLDNCRRSALHDAAASCDVEVVRALLEAGADRNLVGAWKLTPLRQAVVAGNASVLRLLLDGADVDEKDEDGWTVLHYAACWTDCVETARVLLSTRANTYARDKEGKTPLHYAAVFNHVNMVQILLEATNVDVTDYFGFTPMHCAADHGHTAIVSVLLEAGANKAGKDIRGYTAYDMCKGELKVRLK